MNIDEKITGTGSYPRHFLAVIATTILSIAVSIYCLSTGRFIVSQNLFYFPIIIACFYYLKKGFLFSVLLAFSYLIAILVYSPDFIIIREAFITVVVFVAIAGVTTFISIQRKKTENALHESEKKYRLFFEKAGESILILEAEGGNRGRIVEVNHAAVIMHGYTREELLAMKITDLDADESATSLPEKIKLALKGEWLSGEVVHVRKDGTKFPLEINAGLMNFGKKKYIIAMDRDISDRKQAEAKLEYERNQLLSLLNSIDDLIYISDPFTYEMLYVNDASVRLLRKNPVGGLCYRELQGKDRPCDFCTNEIILGNKDKPYKWEYHNPSLNLDLEIVDRIIKWPDGRDVRFEFAKNITKRKQAENELRTLNEKLEEKVEERTCQLLAAQAELVHKEKLAVIGAIAAGIGNELRNPLGVMNNAVYFLKTVIPDADYSVKEYLDIIRNEIDNSQSIISELLDAARTGTPEKTTISAGKLIAMSIDKCQIPEKINVRTDIPDTLPGINIDPLQISQAIRNLIANAVQAMPNGGQLTVAARQVSGVGERRPGVEDLPFDADFMEISVANTGESISPENMEKLFQPLFTTKARGIGLGLLICRNLVEANGGRIEVKSPSGKGTIFMIILPYR